MRNVTISLPENVARWARVRAAELDSSLSRLIADMLTERMQSDLQYQSAEDKFVRRQPSLLKEKGTTYPRRESLHDR